MSKIKQIRGRKYLYRISSDGNSRYRIEYSFVSLFFRFFLGWSEVGTRDNIVDAICLMKRVAMLDVKFTPIEIDAKEL